MTGLVAFIVREGETPAVDAAVVNDAGPAGIGATAALDGGPRRRTAGRPRSGRRRGQRARGARGRDRLARRLPAGRAGHAPSRDRDAPHRRPRPVRRGDPGRRRPAGDARGRRHVHRAAAADDRAHDPLRRPERRPDGPVRAGDRRLLRLLLRLHPHRHQLPPRADRRDAGAADGDAGHAGRGRARLHPRLRALRRRSRSGSCSCLVAGHGARSPPSARCPSFSDRPRAADRRQPAPRLPRGGARRRSAR